MSTIDTAYSLPQAGALPAHVLVRDARAKFGPWGFWGSSGWALLAGAAGLFAVFVYTIIWMLTHGLRAVNAEDPAYANATSILVLSAPMIVLVIAAKIRKLSLRDYFALDGFSLRNLAIGIACLMALIVAFSTVQILLGINGGSKYVEATYLAAKAAGVLPLLWLSVVVVAPVTEELFFRLGAVVARHLRHRRRDVGAVGLAASAVQRPRHPVHLRDGADLRLDAPAQR
jgi:hypothetical protein